MDELYLIMALLKQHSVLAATTQLLNGIVWSPQKKMNQYKLLPWGSVS